MKRIEFECICELAEFMNNHIENNISEDNYPIISAYGNYDVAKSLVEALIMLGNPVGSIIELEEYNISHYDKEYCICLTEKGVACEKIYHEDGYYNSDSDIAFVHEDCNSKLLKYIGNNIVYEFSVAECADDECDYDCNKCCECQCACTDDTECTVKSDDDGYTITVRCNLDADEAMEMIKDMENRMEHMNDMFREMDEWRKLFRW